VTQTEFTNLNEKHVCSYFVYAFMLLKRHYNMLSYTICLARMSSGYLIFVLGYNFHLSFR